MSDMSDDFCEHCTGKMASLHSSGSWGPFEVFEPSDQQLRSYVIEILRVLFHCIFLFHLEFVSELAKKCHEIEFEHYIHLVFDMQFLVIAETPGHGSGWAETPRTDRGGDLIQETPTPSASKRKSRWDETPMGGGTPGSMTPSAMTPSAATPSGMTPGGLTPSMTPGGMTPSGMTPGGFTPSGSTPTGQKAMAMATPTPGHLMSMTPEQLQAYTLQRELDERNRPLTDDELDTMFPPGYKASDSNMRNNSGPHLTLVVPGSGFEFSIGLKCNMLFDCIFAYLLVKFQSDMDILKLNLRCSGN